MSRYLFPSGLRCQWQLRKILHTPQVFSELHPPLSHLLWWGSVGLQINEMKINLHPCFAQMKQEMSIPSIFTECCSPFVIFLAQVGHSCSDEWFVMQCEFDSPHTCMIYIKLAGSPWVCHTFLRFSRLLIIMCPSVFFPGMCHQNKEKSPMSFCTCPHLYRSDCDFTLSLWEIWYLLLYELKSCLYFYSLAFDTVWPWFYCFNSI